MGIFDEIKDGIGDDIQSALWGILFGHPWITVPLAMLAFSVYGFWKIPAFDGKLFVIFGALSSGTLLLGTGFEFFQRWQKKRSAAEIEKASQALKSGDYLVHWHYTPELWERYMATEWRNHRAGIFFLSGLWTTLGIFHVLKWRNAEFLGQNTDFYLTILVVVIALSTLLNQGALQGVLSVLLRRRRPFEVYIGRNSLLVGSAYYTWIKNAEQLAVAREAGSPEVLVFSYRGGATGGVFARLFSVLTIFGGAISKKDWFVRIPVPDGLDEEAQAVLSQILRRKIQIERVRAETRKRGKEPSSGEGFIAMMGIFTPEISSVKNGKIIGKVQSSVQATVNNRDVVFSGIVTIVNQTSGWKRDLEVPSNDFSCENVPMSDGDIFKASISGRAGEEVFSEAVKASVTGELTISDDSSAEDSGSAEAVIAQAKRKLPLPKLPLFLLIGTLIWLADVAVRDILIQQMPENAKILLPFQHEILSFSPYFLTSYVSDGFFIGLILSAMICFVLWIVIGMMWSAIARIIGKANEGVPLVSGALLLCFCAIRLLFFPDVKTTMDTERKEIRQIRWNNAFWLFGMPSETTIPFDSVQNFSSRLRTTAYNRRASENFLSIYADMKSGASLFLSSTESSNLAAKNDTVQAKKYGEKVAAQLRAIVGIAEKANPQNEVFSAIPDTKELLINMPEDSLTVRYVVQGKEYEVDYYAYQTVGTSQIMSEKKAKARGKWEYTFKTTRGQFISVSATNPNFSTELLSVEIWLDGKKVRSKSSDIGLCFESLSIPLEKKEAKK